jgi:hypothetical protein
VVSGLTAASRRSRAGAAPAGRSATAAPVRPRPSFASPAGFAGRTQRRKGTSCSPCGERRRTTFGLAETPPTSFIGTASRGPCSSCQRSSVRAPFRARGPLTCGRWETPQPAGMVPPGPGRRHRPTASPASRQQAQRTCGALHLTARIAGRGQPGWLRSQETWPLFPRYGQARPTMCGSAVHLEQ